MEEINKHQNILDKKYFDNLISYHTARVKTFGYAKKDYKYRFYILEDFADVKQPYEKKNVQVSAKIEIDDSNLIK